MCGAFSCATSINSTAPIAKLGATRQFAPADADFAASRSGSTSKPVVPTTAWTPASRQARALASAVSGVVKSTTTSASARTSPRATPSAGSAFATSSMSPAPSTASQTACPMRPAAPETPTEITCRRPGRYSSCGSQALADRRQGLAEMTLAASHAGGREPLGAVELGGQLSQVVHLHGVHLGQHLVEAVDREVEESRTGDAGHPRRRRLGGEDEAALDVLLGPRQLLAGDRLGAQPLELGADDRARLLDVVLT